jgi:hypothetical protein
MKKDDKHYKKGMDILDMFCTIEEMDSIAVAENSLYREFV